MAQAGQMGLGRRGLVGGMVLAAGAAVSLGAIGDGILGSGLRQIEVRANTHTKAGQDGAAVGIDAAGNLVVIWGSRRQEGGNWGVFGQSFDPLGRPLGTETHVNESTAGAQWHPDLAVASDGSSWAVWESNAPGDADGAIVARRFGPGLSPLSGDVVVSQRVSGYHGTPTVAIDPQGRALVCWVSSLNSRTTVLGRFLSADGAPLGNEFELAAVPGHDDSSVAVAFQKTGAEGAGRFVVAWGRAEAGTDLGIFARVVDAAGGFAGPEIAVSGAPGIEPSLGCDEDGRFVVAWMTEEAHSGAYGVSAARFASDGKLVQAPWTVAPALLPEAGWQNGAAVAVADDGRFLIAYNAFDANLPPLDPADKEDIQRRTRPSSVLAQAYGPEGMAVGGAFRVNAFDKGTQQLTPARAAARVVWGSQGQVALAWSGRTDQSERSGVGLTLLAPGSLDAPTPVAVAPAAAVVEMAEADLAPPEPNAEAPGRPDADQAIAGDDFGFQAWAATEWTPPDPDLAVGPDHIVSVVNMALRIHDKQGNLLFNQDLRNNNGFFGQGAGDFMFDPVAFYDHQTQRFVVGCAEYDAKEGLWVAVSDDSNPMGAWKTFYHNTISKGGFPDFENMGVDEDAIYFANDHFGNFTNWVTAFDKAALVNGQNPSVKTIKTNSDILSLGSIKNYDTGTSVQYFVSAWSGQATKLRIEAIRDPLGNINKSTFLLTVPGFSDPLDAPQKGTATKIAAIDTRIKNGVQRDGHVYVAHGVVPAGQNRTMVRWYEIDPRGWPDSGQDPVLVQSGNIDLGNGIYTWFPDVTVDQFGTMGIVYARSSSTEYASVNRAFRYKDDPAGTLQDHRIMVSSTSADFSGRWGDYFGIETDPAEPGTFWGHGEYRTDNWRTWVGKFSTAVPCPADCDGSGDLSLFDFLCFVNLFNDADDAADCEDNGVFDLFDFLCFTNQFNEGC
jgi:hypothetical protein